MFYKRNAISSSRGSDVQRQVHPRSCLSGIFQILYTPTFQAATPKRANNADFIVYGGTASGVMAAYTAAREGLSVILLEPRQHVGGMVTGGLSATDVAHFQIIGGYARDFYVQAAAHYGVHDLDRTENWRSEPHVGEAIFTKMLADAGVAVHFHEMLREQHGVTMSDGKITSITTTDGNHWTAKSSPTAVTRAT